MIKVLVHIVTVYIRWTKNPSVGYLSFRSNLIGSLIVTYSLKFPYRNIAIVPFQKVKFGSNFDFGAGLVVDIGSYTLSYTLDCTHWNIIYIMQQNACCETEYAVVG
jgi:hypothetical protein